MSDPRPVVILVRPVLVVMLVTLLVFSHLAAYHAGRSSAFVEAKHMIEQAFGVQK
jgi:hypothetical protein